MGRSWQIMPPRVPTGLSHWRPCLLLWALLLRALLRRAYLRCDARMMELQKEFASGIWSAAILQKRPSLCIRTHFWSRFFKVSVLLLVVLFGCLYQVSGIHHCSTSSRSLSTSRNGTYRSIRSLSSSYSCGRLLLAFDIMIWYEMTFSHSLMPASSTLSNCQNIVCSYPSHEVVVMVVFVVAPRAFYYSVITIVCMYIVCASSFFRRWHRHDASSVSVVLFCSPSRSKSIGR
jgi:hypothetical protein